jgi:hypothetical protein
MNAHAESLDSMACVVLGFAGVLVGLGATAQSAVSDEVAFQVGLRFAVLAALLVAVSFLPRCYPVLEVGRLRENDLTASDDPGSLRRAHGPLGGRAATALRGERLGWWDSYLGGVTSLPLRPT